MDALDHGLAGKDVEARPVEEGVELGKHGGLVSSQAADEAEAVDGLGGVDGHRVDEGDEGEAIAQGEPDDAGGGQQGCGSHLHIRYLHTRINEKYARMEHCQDAIGAMPQHLYTLNIGKGTYMLFC